MTAAAGAASAAAAKALDADRAKAAGLASEVAQKAQFDAIRYSQSWEDPDCLRDGLDIGPDDTVLSIAAAGDNSFALLLLNPAKVVSVDMNPSQVALVELKRAAILTLEHAELLRFLGVTQAHDRSTLYTRVRGAMPADARLFWDHNTELILRGVIHVGRLEHFFRMFRSYVRPLTHSKRTVRGLFVERTPDARQRYYDKHFDNLRWRLLTKAAFSQFAIGRFGRDPAFYEHVNIPSVSGYYTERARHALAEQPVHENWFVQYILLGRYLDANAAHPYLREQNLPVLRERMARLEVHCEELETFLGRQEPGTFDKFNLSDIFEWMSDELYEQMLRALVRTSRVGGRLAYWNHLVQRTRPASLAAMLEPQAELAREIHDRDKALFYRDFVIEEVTALPSDLVAARRDAGGGD